MQETVTLHAPGAIPGIPGESHGPGTFLVDYDARTIEEVKQAEPTEAQPPQKQVEQEQAPSS
jgi:hypothetical protein